MSDGEFSSIKPTKGSLEDEKERRGELQSPLFWFGIHW